MTAQQHEVITAVVRRAPEWIRHDLLSKDASARERAEEALAAMIAAALQAEASTDIRSGPLAREGA